MSRKDFDRGLGLSKLPKAKTAEIVVQEVDNELLIYNLTTNEAHHLNKTVTMVWRNCDGTTTFDDMAEALSRELGEKVEADFVFVAISELEKIGLLTESVDADAWGKISRRNVLFRYALPALAIPVVVSLVTPASAQVQGSCLGQFELNCLNPATPCCPGLVCTPQQQGGVAAPGICVPVQQNPV
ncbi:MAG: PqqD family protein [Pyrinomonadaceae bacterium]